VEAEYGSVVIEGTVYTAAHHQPSGPYVGDHVVPGGRPAPCNDTAIPPVAWDVEGGPVALVSHLDLDTVGGLLRAVADTRSRELFTLTVAGLCVGVAFLAALMDLSLVLGAFVAGLAVSECIYKHRILSDIAPIKDLFLTIFFVSVGLGIDLREAISSWQLILALTAGIILGKALLIGVIARVIGLSWRAAVFAGIGLGSAGEFILRMAVTTVVICRYADDYIVFIPPRGGAPDYAHAEGARARIISVCDALGLPIAKFEGPAPELVFIGSGIDTIRMRVFVPHERVDYTISLLRTWLRKQFAKEGEIMSLAGQLSFISRVIRWGRPYKCLPWRPPHPPAGVSSRQHPMVD
jgi:hypothetical protein